MLLFFFKIYFLKLSNYLIFFKELIIKIEIQTDSFNRESEGERPLNPEKLFLSNRRS